MGKGDKKSKRGKITMGSYGKTRLRKSNNAVVAAKPVKEKKVAPAKEVKATPAVEKPKTTRKKKTEE